MKQLASARAWPSEQQSRRRLVPRVDNVGVESSSVDVFARRVVSFSGQWWRSSLARLTSRPEKTERASLRKLVSSPRAQFLAQIEK